MNFKSHFYLPDHWQLSFPPRLDTDFPDYHTGQVPIAIRDRSPVWFTIPLKNGVQIRRILLEMTGMRYASYKPSVHQKLFAEGRFHPGRIDARDKFVQFFEVVLGVNPSDRSGTAAHRDRLRSRSAAVITNAF